MWQEDDGFRLPETGKLPAAGDVQDSQPLGIPSSEATGSPRTPNTKKASLWLDPALQFPAARIRNASNVFNMEMEGAIHPIKSNAVFNRL